MRFRYYITNLHVGAIEGSNSLDVAENFANSEDYFVVDSETGQWLQSDGGRVEVVDCEDA